MLAVTGTYVRSVESHAGWRSSSRSRAGGSAKVGTARTYLHRERAATLAIQLTPAVALPAVTMARAIRKETWLIRNVVRYFYRSTFRIMPAAPAKTSRLLRLARRGPLRARDLDAAEIPRAYLARLVSSGQLEKTGRGLYRLSDSEPTELRSLAEVVARVPEGIVCLLSALQVHGLTTEAPHAVWLMIDSRARTPKIESPAIEIVRAHGPPHDHGVEIRSIEGVKVRLTTPAKTVADCFRYRRHVGLDVALAALRDFLGQRGRSVDALVAAAHADRIYSVMRPYLEALA
jgi:hypothetical protein